MKLIKILIIIVLVNGWMINAEASRKYKSNQKSEYIKGLEVGYGYTQGSYDYAKYDFFNPTYIANLIIYQEYSDNYRTLFSNDTLNSSLLLSNYQLKIPIEYVNTRITTNNINASVWGFSFGVNLQHGYCNKLSESQSIDYLNNYGLGLNLLFVGNIDNKYDYFYTNPDTTIIKSIDLFTIFEQYESKISYRSNSMIFSLGYMQKVNTKWLVIPKWTLNKVIEFGINEMVDLYVSKLFKKNETLIPIANFILKAGLNFLITDMRSSNNNWPFDGANSFITRTLYISFSGGKFL